MNPPDMPPVRGKLRADQDFYQLAWLPDGYPGQRRGEEIYAHPLYGTYVLNDYLDQMRSHPSEDLAQAVRTVGRACLDRMERNRNALVFWYQPDGDNARSLQQMYSGLTQAYYAIALARAGRMLDDPDLTASADEVFRSLLIPVADGGVLTTGIDGPHIAEFPQEPTGFVLNGWQSAISAVVDYAAVSGSAEAAELGRSSAAELARMLPLYDAPALRNSRYGLTGFTYARLVFRGVSPDVVAVRAVRVEIPGGGTHPVKEVGGHRWQYHVLDQDVRDPHSDPWRPVENLMRFNVILSRASYPEANRLVCEISGPAMIVDVQVQQGRYDPLTVAPADRSWVTVARFDCPDGESVVDAPIPWDVADLVAYPTNFAKKLDGRNCNVYHAAHVKRLRELGASTGVVGLIEWADVWQRYMGEWQAMEMYRGLAVRWGRKTVELDQAYRALPTRPAPLRVTDHAGDSGLVASAR